MGEPVNRTRIREIMTRWTYTAGRQFIFPLKRATGSANRHSQGETTVATDWSINIPFSAHSLDNNKWGQLPTEEGVAGRPEGVGAFRLYSPEKCGNPNLKRSFNRVIEGGGQQQSHSTTT